MLTIDIPTEYRALAPVIITSPTTRCGTTLLQRLLSSSDNAFIYGEEIGFQVKKFADWLVGMMQHLEKNEANLDEDFQHALLGELNDWRPGMTPPANIMLRSCLHTFYQIPMTLSDYGCSIDRPIWGYKCPAYSHDTIITILTLMPKAKFIYVFRNPFDALESAKARRFVKTDNEVIEYCNSWAKNMSEISGFVNHERMMFIKYEDLIDQKNVVIKKIELFSGIEHIDLSGFDVRVNTFLGEEVNGHSPSQYIRPEKLTASERATAQACVGPIVEHLYG